MDLYEELVRLVDALSQARIDYALCGGMALAVHGYPRFTKDIDLLIRPEDLQRVLGIGEQCGYLDPAGRIPLEHSEVYRTAKVHGTDVLTLDLLLVNPVLEDVWRGRQEVRWKERVLQVVSAAGLGRMKRLAGRDQDLVDLKRMGLEDELDAGDGDNA
jgi:hypothetical protein